MALSAERIASLDPNYLLLNDKEDKGTHEFATGY